MRSKLLSALLIAAVVSGAGALDLQRGKLKVTINEKTGRFAVWGTEDAAKPVWTPLFSADDVTTSKWKLLVNDKAMVLGDDPAFTTAADTTATGARIAWTSKTLVATLALDFVLSAQASVADGLKLTLSVINTGDASVRLGVRWVLDTNLGEKAGKEHFRLATGDSVAQETKVEGTLPEWWSSRPTAEDQPGLLVMTGKTVTPPVRIVFANWKRLDDAAWDPAFKQGRDFSQLPYSFNDSAAAELFETADLAPGATREVNTVFGLASAGTFVGYRVGSANPLDDLLKKNQNPSLSALDQDLVSLQTLLAQLDAKLADPTKVTAEDVRLVQAVLDQIDARRKALEATKP